MTAVRVVDVGDCAASSVDRSLVLEARGAGIKVGANDPAR